MKPRDERTQTAHHLAAVADAKTKRVSALKEGAEHCRKTIIVENRRRPAAAGAENVAVREPAAGCQPLETRKIQTPREEIGHMNIPGFESGTQEGRSHFVL